MALEVSSHVLTQHLVGPSTLRTALQIGRGGAAAYAASAAADALVRSASASPRGGFSCRKAAPAPAAEERIFGVPVSPEGKSAFYMALAMAMHNFGYAIARSITVTLFTSGSTGFAGYAAAFPLAMSFVSPVSLMLLLGYGNLLDRLGPRGALTRTTLYCSLTIFLAALSVSYLTGDAIGGAGDLMVAGIPAVKWITAPLFIFREAYVQLLTSQYWSFIASVLTPNQSSRWFAPIAGLTSIASAASGSSVSKFVKVFGLPGTLIGTSLSLLLSLGGSHYAYEIADKYNFTPKDSSKTKKATTKLQPRRGATSKELSNLENASIFTKAAKLFARVPVLWALFLEILASQGLTTVLNVCFVQRLETAFPRDEERAGWVGVFYAMINVITMGLQFFVLPPLMTVIEPRDLWRAIPVISLLFSCFQAMQDDPSLYVVSASFLVIKVIEYSARRMLDEMVFVPLDFESRFVGKVRFVHSCCWDSLVLFSQSKVSRKLRDC